MYKGGYYLNDKKNQHSFNRITGNNFNGPQHLGNNNTGRIAGFSDDDPTRTDGP